MTQATIPPTIIDWSDKKAKISKYFKVKEATYLVSWGVYHIPSEQEKIDILRMAKVMDKIRAFLGVKIEVHCWIRPSKVNSPGFDPSSIRVGPSDRRRESRKAALAALDYNAFIDGAPASGHIPGLAVDFHADDMLCDDVRALLLPMLETWGIRMEDWPRSGWVHVDLKPPFRGKRFFKP